MFIRTQAGILKEKFFTKKAIVLLGPRQVGKTTLVNELQQSFIGAAVYLNCDEPLVREQLTNASTETLANIIGNSQLVIIDEAQRVENIGLTLKLITDNFKKKQLIVTGSSALDLASEINEPLTGRKWEYYLYPISWGELTNGVGYLPALQQLETRLVFGMYPDVINNTGNEKEVLTNLVSSYLYKDLLSYKGIRKPRLLEQLLTALALQLGNEVSLNELSKLLQVDKNTVDTYIDMLEKAFVVFKLWPYSRNVRNEITSNRKIYFYDNGVRNAVISQFNPLALRQDTGALWENFLISERWKRQHYQQFTGKRFFWRTKTQQEIDYMEEDDGKLKAFEFKWKNNKNAKVPTSFKEGYPEASFEVVDKDNFYTFLKE